MPPADDGCAKTYNGAGILLVFGVLLWVSKALIFVHIMWSFMAIYNDIIFAIYTLTLG